MKRKKVLALVLCFAMLFVFSGGYVQPVMAGAAVSPAVISKTAGGETMPSWTAHKLTYSAPSVTNPLKGFIPYSNPDDDGFTEDVKAQTYYQLPYSMEWFYLPLNAVMKGENKYDWSAFEDRLNNVASRGHQAVLRFYVDYPDKPCGIPKYLMEGGLKTHTYVDFNNGTHAESLSPDYNDPRMMKALTSFIKALGAKYDGDPRIGFITEGLIGFWGEWHTWPHDGYTPSTGKEAVEKEVYKDPNDGTIRLTDWMPTPANQDKILESFDSSFNTTKIQLRQPMGTNGHSVDLDMGYHDDSFAYETLSPDYDPVTGQSWMFWGRMEAAGATESWKTNPMGGEIRPEIQSTMFNYDPPKYHQDNPLLTNGGQDFYTSLNVTHTTWLLSQVLFATPLSEAAKARVMEADSKLGYVFYVSKSYIENEINAGKILNVGIELDNLGVAPFYYNWEVLLGLKDSSGKLVKTWKTNWNITKIQPNAKKVFTWTVANNGIKKIGKYTVVMRVVNPLEKIKISKGKATKLMFANKNQNKDGWLALSTINVTAGKSGK
ncbi:MAG: S-layer domain protein [Firmicutes bacterium]|nr:S-layer domain protein [Bacillota bacterium]